MRRLLIVTLFSAASGIPAVAAAQDDPRPLIWPTVRVAAPEGLSAAFSVQPRLPGPLNRMIVSAGVGRNGRRLAVGYGWFGSNLMAGYAVQAVLLRTGADPVSAAPHQTYLGVESAFMLANISVRRGYAFRVGGRTPTEDWAVMTLSIGFGF
jgi:hypothetical protein